MTAWHMFAVVAVAVLVGCAAAGLPPACKEYHACAREVHAMRGRELISEDCDISNGGETMSRIVKGDVTEFRCKIHMAIPGSTDKMTAMTGWGETPELAQCDLWREICVIFHPSPPLPTLAGDQEQLAFMRRVIWETAREVVRFFVGGERGQAEKEL